MLLSVRYRLVLTEAWICQSVVFFFYQTRKRIAAIPDRRLKLVPFIPTPDASVETLFALEGRSVASVAISVSVSATATLSRPLLDTGAGFLSTVVCEIAA